jgi:hypothetical protein
MPDPASAIDQWFCKGPDDEFDVYADLGVAAVKRFNRIFFGEGTQGRQTTKATPADTTQPPAHNRRPRMRVEEANEKAMDLLKQLGRGFFSLSEREQVKRIGCHPRTWHKTPLYQKARRGGAIPTRRATPGSPTAVNLSDKMLETLIDDHERDFEPSPTDSTSHKVYHRKRP